MLTVDRQVGGVTTVPRVLHVNRVGFLGGVERVILTLAQGSRPRFEALIACPPGAFADSARAAGTRVLATDFNRMRASGNPAVLARYPFAVYRFSGEIRRLCLLEGIDIIHAHHPVGALYALQAARNLGLPLVLHVHEILPAKRLYRLALQRAADAADAIICVSGAARELAETAHPDPSVVQVIPNGVQQGLAAAAGKPPKFVPDGKGPHIGIFGVLEPRKGQDVFLRAAAQIKARYPGAKFWVVGALSLKDKSWYLDRLRALAQVPVLEGDVVFTGYRPDATDMMKAMDVVVVASVAQESLSMVLLEALTLGRRVVSSRIGGTGEVIADGVTGLLVPLGDAEALAGAVDKMLGPGGAAMAANGRSDAAIRFSPNAFCTSVAEVYDRVLARAYDQRRAS